MSQNEQVLSYLKGKNKLTTLDAMNKWGILRLGARIWDLRRQGHTIKVETIQVYNRFGDRCSVAQYSLIK